MSEATIEVEEPGRPASWPGRIAVAVLAVAVAAGLAAWWTSRGTEKTDDAFVEAADVTIAAQVPGRVEEVAVDEHAHVEAGDLLVRLDASEYELAVAAARARLETARNRIEQAKAASASTDAEQRAAVVEVWRTERELERVKQLHQRRAISQRDLDAARAEHDAAQARVRALALRAEAERAMLGNEAPVLEAQAALRRAELDLARTRIRAPFAGVVGRKNVEPGAVVGPRQPLMLLISDRDPWVMANFKETQLRGMRVGSRAEVRVDAYPDVVWDAHVASFSPATGATYALIRPEPAAGNFTKVVQRVPVKIALDAVREGAPTTTLAAGLSAEVQVAVD